MLSQTQQWVNFSNHSRGKLKLKAYATTVTSETNIVSFEDINPGYASSLESIHDQIHVYVGGDNGGHMSAPTVAGMFKIISLNDGFVSLLNSFTFYNST